MSDKTIVRLSLKDIPSDDRKNFVRGIYELRDRNNYYLSAQLNDTTMEDNKLTKYILQEEQTELGFKIFSHKRNNSIVLLMYDTDDQVCGLAVYDIGKYQSYSLPLLNLTEDTAILSHFWIDEKHRKQGYGTELWKSVLRYAKQDHATYIITTLNSFNKEGNAFFNKNGMKCVEKWYTHINRFKPACHSLIQHWQGIEVYRNNHLRNMLTRKISDFIDKQHHYLPLSAALTLGRNYADTWIQHIINNNSSIFTNSAQDVVIADSVHTTAFVRLSPLHDLEFWKKRSTAEMLQDIVGLVEKTSPRLTRSILVLPSNEKLDPLVERCNLGCYYHVLRGKL